MTRPTPTNTVKSRPAINSQITPHTALVFGSSGLVGGEIVSALLTDNFFDRIVIFNRKPSAKRHPKITEIIVDFDNETQLAEHIKGEVVFCCLGTTIKKAGNREAFQLVDLHYPDRIARIAAKNGVKKFLLISSIGANARSNNFYLQTKGLCEEKILNDKFSSVFIFRPGLLLGKRTEFRPAEWIAQQVMALINVFFVGKLKRYAAVRAGQLANCMLHYAKNCNEKVSIIENEAIIACKS